MRRKIQILSLVLLVSGLMHISEIFTNWKYDLHAGLILIIPSIIWFVRDYLSNGRTLSTRDSVTVYSKLLNWNVLIQIPAFLVLLYFFIADFDDIPDSILLTLILYFSLKITIEIRKFVEITNHYVDIFHNRIRLNSINYIDFRSDKIILVRRDDYISQVDITHSDFSPENLSIILNTLKKSKNSNQQSV